MLPRLTVPHLHFAIFFVRYRYLRDEFDEFERDGLAMRAPFYRAVGGGSSARTADNSVAAHNCTAEFWTLADNAAIKLLFYSRNFTRFLGRSHRCVSLVTGLWSSLRLPCLHPWRPLFPHTSADAYICAKLRVRSSSRACGTYISTFRAHRDDRHRCAHTYTRQHAYGGGDTYVIYIWLYVAVEWSCGGRVGGHVGGRTIVYSADYWRVVCSGPTCRTVHSK